MRIEYLELETFSVTAHRGVSLGPIYYLNFGGLEGKDKPSVYLNVCRSNLASTDA